MVKHTSKTRSHPIYSCVLGRLRWDALSCRSPLHPETWQGAQRGRRALRTDPRPSSRTRRSGIAQDVPTTDNRDIRPIGQSVTLSRTPSKIVAPPPQVGERTNEAPRRVRL
jgi:hypothetical protein